MQKGRSVMKPVFASVIFVMILSTCGFIYAQGDQTQLSVPRMTIMEFQAVARDSNFIIVDVRSKDSRLKNGYEATGCVWINPSGSGSIQTFVQTANKNSMVLIYCSCKGDYASIQAARILSENGFTNTYVLTGGWKAWTEANMPISPIAGKRSYQAR